MTWLMWLLVFVLIVAAVVVKIKRSARIVVFRSESGRVQVDNSRQIRGFRTSNVEQMVSCTKCGIYVPASDAVFRTGKVYCCEEHSATMAD
jgi:hypothetical protein